MEEGWAIEEVDFNMKGLSMDCFLPPGGLKKEEEGCGLVTSSSNPKLPFKIRSTSFKTSASEVAAIDLDAVDHENFNSTSDDDDDD
ncbi:hypothetical protein PanWU01x14_090930 [Parasponia andersonii]|uniref:Uncharacterized protein n=1 Tax=Parasponia andersonii TaxID=3476 RepID=A0A2P5D769_PARAD|nr:hypothetical protein PanWU01x14_090930 [Parasponia andersonii]